MTDDLEQVIADAYPRCELCDALLEPVDHGGRLYWRCPSCAATAISR